LVTSHGAGMAVPDWPTTYGYNMFFFPVSKWVGGIFYEHSHRLVASVVGLFTAILAGWIWNRETIGWMRRVGLSGIVVTLGLMGVRRQEVFVGIAVIAAVFLCFSLARMACDERKLRWLAMIAFCTVLVQGVLGGLRVTAMKDEIGIFHGTLAQMFFALLCVIALLTSPWWRRGGWQKMSKKMSIYGAGSLRYLLALVTGIVLLQLILGATMRHQHAGLAISDFPLAYGQLWPAMDAESVAKYNQARGEVTATNPITSAQIALQMAHRMVACLILAAVAGVALWARRRFGGGSILSRLSLAWFGLIVLQATLGAATIWTNKAADIATAHVAVGACSLASGVMLALIAVRLFRKQPVSDSVSSSATVGLQSSSANAIA